MLLRLLKDGMHILVRATEILPVLSPIHRLHQNHMNYYHLLVISPPRTVIACFLNRQTPQLQDNINHTTH